MPDIWFLDDHFVGFNNIFNFIVDTFFKFFGIDLCFTCGNNVDFLFQEFGWNNNTIEGGFLSFVD